MTLTQIDAVCLQQRIEAIESHMLAHGKFPNRFCLRYSDLFETILHLAFALEHLNDYYSVSILTTTTTIVSIDVAI